MRFKHIILTLLVAIPSLLHAQYPDRPKLVVGIVVDQMRWDYLYRYFDRYGNTGFKRMLNEGFSCENTLIDYAPTITAIGHSTLYTGTVPSVHGITGNDFYIAKTGYRMYCTEDTTVQTVGSPSKAGKMSPRNLLASTITDELKLATNFRSKVIGIALKDRGAILPAGHTADAAYWFDDETGNWITSTYYMNELPGWVQEFNRQKLISKYLTQQWTTLYPIGTYKQSAADDNEYEGIFKNEKRPVFPHNIPVIKGSDFNTIRNTPYGNTLTLDFAKEAINKEKLGNRGITDVLAVSLSSTDYLGHQFTPNSIEVEDTYLRLDKDLGSFLQYLDQKIGKGNYILFLSADHGAAHNPQFMIDHKLPAGIWSSSRTTDSLNSILEQKYGHKKIALALHSYQLHLNKTLITAQQLDVAAIKKDCIDFLRNLDGVATAVDIDQVRNAPIPGPIIEKIINGYYPLRSGDIQVILQPGWYSSSQKTGTTHGSWYAYDAHIPLLWFGWKVKHGKSNRETHMTDVAPTLAALLRIQMPNGNIGQVIEEISK